MSEIFFFFFLQSSQQTLVTALEQEETKKLLAVREKIKTWKAILPSEFKYVFQQ